MAESLDDVLPKQGIAVLDWIKIEDPTVLTDDVFDSYLDVMNTQSRSKYDQWTSHFTRFGILSQNLVSSHPLASTIPLGHN